jgi:hypothetical protein
MYTANAAAGNTGTGLLGSGLMGWDNSNSLWRKICVSPGSSQNVLSTLVASGNTDAATPGLGALQTSGSESRLLIVQPFVFNGASYDRARNNTSNTVLASAARTATQNVSVTTYNARTMTLIVNVSSAGTGSITPAIQLTDSVSGNNFTVWTAAAALTANGTYVYRFEPGNTGTTGGLYTEKITSGVPGRTLNVLVTANNANSITYSVSLELQ